MSKDNSVSIELNYISQEEVSISPLSVEKNILKNNQKTDWSPFVKILGDDN